MCEGRVLIRNAILLGILAVCKHMSRTCSAQHRAYFPDILIIQRSKDLLERIGFITGTRGNSNKKLEPISSEVALQHPDPTHPVKLGAHSIYLSLGVGYQLLMGDGFPQNPNF